MSCNNISQIIFFKDVGNVPLSLQFSMISEENVIQPTNQCIKLKYLKPFYYCQHKLRPLSFKFKICEAAFCKTVTLILLGQQWTGKNLMQCFLRSSRQHSIKVKILYNFVLILLGQHCTGQKPRYVMLPKRGSRQLCIRKSPVQCCFNTLGITLHSWKPYTMLPEKLQTTLNKKKSCAIFSLYSRNNIAQIKNLCNVVRKAPDNIS